MSTLLRIDTSARLNGSHSRQIADEIQKRWLEAHQNGVVKHRDLAEGSIGHIENDTIIGYYTPKKSLTDQLQRATAQSDQLIAELMNADALLISTPMYNFTVPSALKAWIDQVVRINKTFGTGEDGQMTGLIKNKPAYIAVSLGAQFTGTELETMDFLRPYLKTLLGFIGFEHVEFFSIESTAVDEAQFEINKRNTSSEIAKMFSVAA